MSKTEEEKNKSEDKEPVDAGREDNLSLLQDILKTNKEILKQNEEIANSSSFIKKYVRNRIIITTAKWILIVAVLIFGFLSLSSAFDYLRDNIDYYEDKLGQVTDFMEKGDNN